MKGYRHGLAEQLLRYFLFKTSPRLLFQQIHHALIGVCLPRLAWAFSQFFIILLGILLQMRLDFKFVFSEKCLSIRPFSQVIGT
jgi:hypothetical protein